MSETEIRERVTNLVLLLHLIEQANAEGRAEDELKIQKLVFLAQKRLVERQLKAFSYNFFRWQKGPFSKNLRIDLITLFDSDFLTRRNDRIELTKKAKEILLDCSELFDKNESFLKPINNIVWKYSRYSPDEIKESVYALKVVVPRIRQIMTIRDVPPRQLILFKTSDRKARAVFNIDASWLATLELYFNQEAMSSLEKAVDDAIEGRVYGSGL